MVSALQSHITCEHRQENLGDIILQSVKMGQHIPWSAHQNQSTVGRVQR